MVSSIQKLLWSGVQYDNSKLLPTDLKKKLDMKQMPVATITTHLFFILYPVVATDKQFLFFRLTLCKPNQTIWIIIFLLVCLYRLVKRAYNKKVEESWKFRHQKHHFHNLSYVATYRLCMRFRHVYAFVSVLQCIFEDLILVWSKI